MLDREDFANRFKNHEAISLHEFMYPLLQGHDSVHMKADLELGGTDQLFNMHMGRHLQHRVGMSRQAIMTMPILLGTDGHQKMSKSLGNTINFNDSAYIIKQKIINMPDSNIDSFIELLTDFTPEELSDKTPSELKLMLCDSILKVLQKEDDAVTLVSNIPILVTTVLNRTNITKNSAAARDLVKSGSVFINGVKADLDTRLSPGEQFLLKPGKRTEITIKIEHEPKEKTDTSTIP